MAYHTVPSEYTFTWIYISLERRAKSWTKLDEKIDNTVPL